MRSVAIIGGGIAGLTIALRLQQRGVPYVLIESERVLGGKIRTESTDGFVIEGGPDSFLAEKPAARELCEELGLESEIIGTNDASRQTFLVSNARLRPLPEGFVMLAPVKPLPLLRSGLISLRGVLRMALEPLIPARRADSDESLGNFVRRRLGDEVFEKIVDPLMSGIYAGNSDDLSILTTFPRLRDLERTHGSIIKGLLRVSGTPAPPRKRSMFLSLRGGMNGLVDAIVRQLDRSSVRTGVHVVSMTRPADYRLELSDGTTLDSGAVVLTTPAFAAAKIVRPLDAKLAELLEQIPYVSTCTVALAYRRNAHPLNGFGFVVPRTERRGITACTWMTTKLPHRAPDDAVLIRCFVGRAGDEDWVDSSDTDVEARCREELQQLMGITTAPLFTRVFRWEKSMPQYRVGHGDLLARINTRLPPGLYLAGSGYRGVGLPDVIRDATASAKAMIEAAREAA
jgi:oxygen-dependent protoporphyrinogen oxidase